MSESASFRIVAFCGGVLLSGVAARVGYLVGIEHLVMGWTCAVCGVLGSALFVGALFGED